MYSWGRPLRAPSFGSQHRSSSGERRFNRRFSGARITFCRLGITFLQRPGGKGQTATLQSPGGKARGYQCAENGVDLLPGQRAVGGACRRDIPDYFMEYDRGPPGLKGFQPPSAAWAPPGAIAAVFSGSGPGIPGAVSSLPVQGRHPFFDALGLWISQRLLEPEESELKKF